MNVLVVTARFPEAGGKGDQSRTAAFVAELSRRHRVTVLTAAAPASAAALARLRRCARVVVVAPAPPGRAFAALAAGARGRPLQSGWMAPGRVWRTTRRLAPAHDVVLVSTLRALGDPIAVPVVLDHVDALSLNMRRRARGPERRHRRAFAALESRLLARAERRAAAWVAGQIVTSEEDAGALPGAPVVIPVTWDGAPAAGIGRRAVDVALTGNMRYPPNEDAARWFTGEMLPRLRAARPDIETVVVGRGADRLGLAGTTVRADVAEMQPHLRAAKIAVVPLRIGTGSPFKLLEAAAAGCAIVATSWAAARFDIPCRVADDTDGFVAAILDLLADEPARARLAATSLAALDAHSTAAAVVRLEALLEAARVP